LSDLKFLVSFQFLGHKGVEEAEKKKGGKRGKKKRMKRILMVGTM